jgi:hypothetical protein
VIQLGFGFYLSGSMFELPYLKSAATSHYVFTNFNFLGLFVKRKGKKKLLVTILYKGCKPTAKKEPLVFIKLNSIFV